MTCENCIHNGVCYLQEVTNDIEEQLKEFGCENYKNKENFVEVVRCENCKYWYIDAGGECVMHEDGDTSWREDDFCSYGELKERGET